MKNYLKNFTLIIILLNSFNAICQVQENNDYERVYIEVGVLYPLDKLKNTIKSAPNFGFWYKSRIKKTEFLDFGFNMSVLKNKMTFQSETNDSIFKNTPKYFAGMVGFKYCKEYSLSDSKNIKLEIFPSIGYAFFFYESKLIGLKNNNSLNDEKSKKALSTFHLGQGIKLNIDNVAVQMQYQFTPYNLFYKNIDENLGSQSLIFGIIYKQ